MLECFQSEELDRNVLVERGIVKPIFALSVLRVSLARLYAFLL